ncbi:MAG: hypothetical protein JWO03_1886 [Bacteroidetes bacterium]|nr:hypothetical protein [Bacteroidota bacterium]
MKRNDIPIVLSTAAFSFLFYKQSAGFNYLLFNILLVALLAVRDSSLIRSKAFLAASAGCIVSSFFVFWYDTTLPFAADMISLVLLAGVSMDRESSFIIAWFHSLYSIIGVGVFMIIDMVRGLNSPHVDSGRTKVFDKVLLAILPVIIFVIFFFIYRSGNPIFDQYAAKINFDFISIGWVFFTLLGFFFMYGFFKQRIIGLFQKADHEASDELPPVSHDDHIKDSPISVSNLVYTGVLLLILLNVLLATVNGLDIYYLGFLHSTPAGITFSQYLHNGTNSLIASIILAVTVILFYFRGYLNFYEGNKWLKGLAYIWIAQNLMLVLSTVYRNTVYIYDFGLTHKRIGVYVYLFLCVAGLVTTFIKIFQRKNNWFLFRKNAWIAYTLMIVACPVDWDTVITTFDIDHFQANKTMEIDQRYLAELGHTNFAQLFQYYIVEDKSLKAQIDSSAKPSAFSRDNYTPYYNKEIKDMLWNKYLYLERDYAPHHWRSHCMSKSNNLHAVEKMIADHKLVCPVQLR